MKNTSKDILETFIIAKPSDPLYSVLPKVKFSNEPILVLNRENELLGLVSLKDIMSHKKRIPKETKINTYIKPLPDISTNTPPWIKASALTSLKVERLPIKNAEGSIYSTVTAKSLLKSAVATPYFLHSMAQNLQVQRPVTCSVTANVGDVYSTMRKHSVSKVILINDQGNCAGIISRSDIASYTGTPSPHQRYSTRMGNPINYSQDNEEISRRNASLGSLYSTPAVTMLAQKGNGKTLLKKLVSIPGRSLVIINKKRQPIGYISLGDALVALSKVGRGKKPAIVIKQFERLKEPQGTKQLIEKRLNSMALKLAKRLPVTGADISFDATYSGTGNIRMTYATLGVSIEGKSDILVTGKGRNILPLLRSLEAAVMKIARRNS